MNLKKHFNFDLARAGFLRHLLWDKLPGNLLWVLVWVCRSREVVKTHMIDMVFFFGLWRFQIGKCWFRRRRNRCDCILALCCFWHCRVGKIVYFTTHDVLGWNDHFTSLLGNHVTFLPGGPRRRDRAQTIEDGTLNGLGLFPHVAIKLRRRSTVPIMPRSALRTSCCSPPPQIPASMTWPAHRVRLSSDVCCLQLAVHALPPPPPTP